MSTELEDAAYNYANNVNIAPSTQTAQTYFTDVHKSFMAGAEWRFNKDEEILNTFFSRESVLEVLRAYEETPQDRYFNLNNWFQSAYPSKTI